ncbi:MAG: DUF3142 domain-containing protein [Caulobacteraceae bacterium]
MRGRYAAFASDAAPAVPAAPPPADPNNPTPNNQGGDEPDPKLFDWAGHAEGYICEDLRKLAKALAAAPGAPHNLLCLGEFARLNGLDGNALNTGAPADELGGVASQFPGQTFARLERLQASDRRPEDAGRRPGLRALSRHQLLCAGWTERMRRQGRAAGRAGALVPHAEGRLRQVRMGDRAEVLLVRARSLALAACALGLMLSRPGRRRHGAGGGLRRHSGFWAGVKPQPVLANARTLYILQGQVAATPNPDAEGRLIARAARFRTSAGARSGSTTAPTPCAGRRRRTTQILARLRRWRAAGDPLVGLQIDFDAHTRRLGEYATFLANLRRRLPPDCRLSITGLLDWSSQGDSAALDALGE